MTKIEQLKEQVAGLLPDGWKACECFFLSLSGHSSPEMISADRDKTTFKSTLAATPMDARAALRKQWRLDTETQAKAVESKLKAAKLKAVRDGGTVYVRQ